MKRFDEIITKIEEFILAFAVLTMAFILIGGVISRSVFNASWTFTEEVGGALNILVTFFAIGYCAREARHISMSIIFDFVNNKTKKLMLILICGLGGLFMLYLGYLSVIYTKSVYDLGRVTAALRIPSWITVAPLVVGFLLAGFEYIRCFFLNILNKDEIYISSKYRLGENTDEALGIADASEERVEV